jgi:hypothetical protein
LHESGHCVAAFAFGEMPAGAVLLGADGALAHCGFTLAATPEAIMVAAGHAAEALAGRFPPPSETPDAPAAATSPPVVLPLSSPDLAEQRKAHAKAVPDRRAIALWAIDGKEDEPEKWAGRVAWLRYQAAAIVADNAAPIVAVAAYLFRIGHIDRFALRLLLEPPDFPSAATTPAEPAIEAPAEPAERVTLC